MAPLMGHCKPRGRIFAGSSRADEATFRDLEDSGDSLGNFGFETYVVEDACRGIDTNGSLAAAWTAMEKAGVKRITSEDLAL